MSSAIAQKDAFQILEERIKRQNGYSYRLDKDKGTYGLDSITDDVSFEVDEGEMSFTLHFANGARRDGVGDLLEISGIDLSRHRSNPLSLFDHGKKYEIPIGKFEHPETKEYTVFLDPIAKIGKGKVFMYQGKGGHIALSSGQEYDHALFCQQLFDLWVKRFIRAGSIGYQVQEARQLQPDYERGTQAGLHLLRILMLEGSMVVLPANQDTVAKSMAVDQVREILAMPVVCGKSLSPILRSTLEPYAADYTKTTVGFVGIKTIPAQQTATIQKTELPKGNLTETNIPPAEWKAGEGAKSVHKEEEWEQEIWIDSAKRNEAESARWNLNLNLVRSGDVPNRPDRFMMRVSGDRKKVEEFKRRFMKSLDDKEEKDFQVLNDALRQAMAAGYNLLQDGAGDWVPLQEWMRKRKQGWDWDSAQFDASNQIITAKNEGITYKWRLKKSLETVGKDFCPNNSRITLSDDYGCPSAYDSKRKGMSACKSCGKALNEVRYLAKDSDELPDSDEKRIEGIRPAAEYNEEVANELSRIDPKRATLLMKRGLQLDWWNIVDKFRYRKQEPYAAAQELAHQEIKGLDDLEEIHEKKLAKDLRSGMCVVFQSKAADVDHMSPTVDGKIKVLLTDGRKFIAEPDDYVKMGQKDCALDELVEQASRTLARDSEVKGLAANASELNVGDEVYWNGKFRKVDHIDQTGNMPYSLRIHFTDGTASSSIDPNRKIETKSIGDKKKKSLVEPTVDDVETIPQGKSLKAIRSKYKSMRIGSSKSDGRIISGGGTQKLSDAGSVRVAKTRDGKYRVEKMDHNGVWRKLIARTFATEQQAIDYYNGSKSLGSIRKKYMRKSFPGEIRTTAEHVKVGDKIAFFSTQKRVLAVNTVPNTDQLEFVLEGGDVKYNRPNDPVYITPSHKSFDTGWKSYGAKNWWTVFDRGNAVGVVQARTEQQAYALARQKYPSTGQNLAYNAPGDDRLAFRVEEADDEESARLGRTRRNSQARQRYAERRQDKFEVEIAHDKEMAEKIAKNLEAGIDVASTNMEIGRQKIKSFVTTRMYNVQRGIKRYKTHVVYWEVEVLGTRQGKITGTIEPFNEEGMYEALSRIRKYFIEENHRLVEEDMRKMERNASRPHARMGATGFRYRKSLDSIRQKYRSVKGLRRRLKTGKAGSSMILIRGKDYDALEKEAQEKGLTINRAGKHTSGLEKVKLTGHDDHIDMMAKKFGRMMRRKSLDGQIKNMAPLPQGTYLKVVTPFQFSAGRGKPVVAKQGDIFWVVSSSTEQANAGIVRIAKKGKTTDYVFNRDLIAQYFQVIG